MKCTTAFKIFILSFLIYLPAIILSGVLLNIQKESNKFEPDRNENVRNSLRFEFPDTAIRGTRSDIKLECTLDYICNQITRVSISIGNDIFDLDREDNSWTYKKHWLWGQETDSVQFTIYHTDGVFHFPDTAQTVTLFETQSEISQDEFIWEVNNVEEFFNETKTSDSQISFNFSFADTTAFKRLKLYYKTNRVGDYQQKTAYPYNPTFRLTTAELSDLNVLDYYFEVEGINTIQIPEDSTFKLYNPKVLKAEEDFQTYLDENNLSALLYLYTEDGIEIDYDGERTFRENGLSTIKIFVMLATFDALDSGKLKKHTIVSRYGFSGTVDKALAMMIENSSNEATGALILGVGGPNNVNKSIEKYLGDDAISFVGHTPGYKEKNGIGNNYVTMREEVELFKMLTNGSLVSKEASGQMLELLNGTYDYFVMRESEYVSDLWFKTGYKPGYQYGVVAKIKTTSENEYILALELWDQNRGYIDKSRIKEAIDLLITSLEGFE